MCRIKSGAQIEEIYDVQNIVTACILRSQRPYSIQGLTKTVEKACKNSSLNITETQIAKMVAETTMAFQRIRIVTACKGRYFAYPALCQSDRNENMIKFAEGEAHNAYVSL